MSTNVDDILLLAILFAQPGRRIASIVVGQFLGVGTLVALSVGGAMAAGVLPQWIPWFGLVPCALGVKLLVTKDTDDQTRATGPRLGVLAIAAVTIANGADNLGVYIPIFASRPEAVPIYAAVFAVGTAVWCFVGYWAVSHRKMSGLFSRYGHRALPWVLIGIGLHILSDLF